MVVLSTFLHTTHTYWIFSYFLVLKNFVRLKKSWEKSYSLFKLFLQNHKLWVFGVIKNIPTVWFGTFRTLAIRFFEIFLFESPSFRIIRRQSTLVGGQSLSWKLYFFRFWERIRFKNLILAEDFGWRVACASSLSSFSRLIFGMWNKWDHFCSNRVEISSSDFDIKFLKNAASSGSAVWSNSNFSDRERRAIFIPDFE